MKKVRISNITFAECDSWDEANKFLNEIYEHLREHEAAIQKIVTKISVLSENNINLSQKVISLSNLTKKIALAQEKPAKNTTKRSKK